MTVYIRLTEKASIIEIRSDYMIGAERVEKATLADALAILLSHVMPARMRIIGKVAHGGFFTDFCFELPVSTVRIWGEERIVHGVEALGKAVEYVLRTRQIGVLRHDGMVPFLPSRIETVTAEIEPLRANKYARIRLLLASNWLMDEWRKRFGRDNAIYVETQDEKLLRQLYNAVVSMKPRHYATPVRGYFYSRIPSKREAKKLCSHIEDATTCNNTITNTVRIVGNPDSDYNHVVIYRKKGTLEGLGTPPCHCETIEAVDDFTKKKYYTVYGWTPLTGIEETIEQCRR